MIYRLAVATSRNSSRIIPIAANNLDAALTKAHKYGTPITVSSDDTGTRGRSIANAVKNAR